MHDDGGRGARQAARAQLPGVAAIDGHVRTIPGPDVDDLRVARIDRIRPDGKLRPGHWQGLPGASTIGAAHEAVALHAVDDGS